MAEEVSPDDVWGVYFTNLDGHPASIMFNESLAERINTVSLPNSMLATIEMKGVREDGMPTASEFDVLDALDDAVADSIESNGGIYLGRITTDGVRQMRALVPQSSESISTALRAVGAAANRNITVSVEVDPSKSAYWDGLYPTATDRQVMNDMRVLDALRNSGDDPKKIRTVNHWAYFQRESDARQFGEWVSEHGFRNIVVERQGGEGLYANQWMVSMSHDGTMMPADISDYTVNLLWKAHELGGTYDGWDTPVVKAEE